MLAAQRRSLILAELGRDGTVKVSDLVARLGVSDMTVRRDLQALHRQGLLEKVHGGAMAVAEPSTAEPGFEANSARRQLEKEAIAVQAASLVRPGSAIAVSAGTTTHAFARHLVDIPDLTVVTNSVWVADLLHRSGRESNSVLVTGGLRTPSDALVGPVAITALSSLHVDAVFLGVHGMEERAGFSTPNLLEAETNRAMIRSGRRLVVLDRLVEVGGRRPELHGASVGGARADHRHRTLRAGQRDPRRAGRAARAGRPRRPASRHRGVRESPQRRLTIAATGPPPSGHAAVRPWWAADTKTARSPVTAAVTPPMQDLICRCQCTSESFEQALLCCPIAGHAEAAVGPWARASEALSADFLLRPRSGLGLGYVTGGPFVDCLRTRRRGGRRCGTGGGSVGPTGAGPAHEVEVLAR